MMQRYVLIISILMQRSHTPIYKSSTFEFLPRSGPFSA